MGHLPGAIYCSKKRLFWF